MRYVYGITGAILLGGAAATLSLNPVGAQTAQNEPGTIAAAPPGGAPMSFANLAERLQPAVVNISTRQSVTVQRRQLPPGFEEFFRRFGGDGQNQQQDEGPVTQRGGSLGSGFIISPDGYIVTNNHVVAPARPDAVVEQITVTLADRTEFEAEVVGRDVASDIALLKITPTRPLPFVRFADSTRVRVGDWVLAIGNPFGLGGTVTAGIVSALHRNIGAGLYDRYIQTDTAINSGNSGGPMFDLNGNVIGINTALYSPTGGNIGIGFAIPGRADPPGGRGAAPRRARPPRLYRRRHAGHRRRRRRRARHRPQPRRADPLGHPGRPGRPRRHRAGRRRRHRRRPAGHARRDPRLSSSPSRRSARASRSS